ncbi:putative ferric-uptake regulator [Herminiimonas arsenicoxydans]|uniref:Ferric-uptake regulator n=1 Tax=Herminiimonas arsenicoxydans TaxID=204773 RepID=A4G983_HERAR|nr:putative ferric-uptake regulator [Herminiimonas arsenicoxydans]
MDKLQLNCKLRHNQHTIVTSIIMKKSATPDYPALAESQLRDTSLRSTAARIKVLAALLGAPYALSHQDVQDTLVDMDRVTLYRALDALTDAGLAHKIAGDDRVFRYNAGAEHLAAGSKNQILHQQHQHGHFKCTRCAKVFCIDNIDEKLLAADTQTQLNPSAVTLRQQLQKVLQATLGKGFQSHEIELTIKGWCADCAH